MTSSRCQPRSRSLNFLIDESTGQAVADYLQGAGHDALYVGDVMVQADDEVILRRAFTERRVLVTNDKDFADKVFRDKLPHAGVLLLRLTDERATMKVSIVRSVVEKFGQRLPNAFTVVTERNIRFR